MLMPSDVMFTLASALGDMNAARRAETKTGDKAKTDNKDRAVADGAQAEPFRSLVEDRSSDTPSARHSHLHAQDGHKKRLMPGQVADRESSRPDTTRQDGARKALSRPEDGSGEARPEREAGKPRHEDRPAPASARDERNTEATDQPADGEKKVEKIQCADALSEAEVETPVEAGEVAPSEAEAKTETESLLLDTALTDAATVLLAAEAANATSQPVPAEAEEVLGAAGIIASTPASVLAEEMQAATGTIAPGIAAGDAAIEEASAKIDGIGVEAGGARQAIAAPQLKGETIAQADAANSEESSSKAEASPQMSSFGVNTNEKGEKSGLNEADKAGQPEAVSGRSGAANLHPTRNVAFADILDGFGGAHSIHRPADILAGLDRNVAAAAMNRHVESSRPTPLQMLPIEIGMQAVRGVSNFQIRLDPAELGRVDVKLQVRDNGEVNASLIVDRVETLQMLRRDASTLQNAFEQAGLKQSPEGLSFSLRGEGQNGQQNERGTGDRPGETQDELALQAEIGAGAMRRALIPNSSIDRMV
jgi:flagellar hook-length control protein FliK